MQIFMLNPNDVENRVSVAAQNGPQKRHRKARRSLHRQTMFRA
jgi:hypothetical protein